MCEKKVVFWLADDPVEAPRHGVCGEGNAPLCTECEEAAAEEEYDNPDRLCTTQGIIVEEFIQAKITWYAG